MQSRFLSNSLSALLAVASACCLAVETQAQSVRQQDLDRCAALATSAGKLRCFEALTRQGQPPPPVVAEPPAPAVAPSPPPGADIPPATTSAPEPDEAVAIKPVPEPVPAEPPVPAAVAKSGEIGAEQLKRQDPAPDDEPATATVVKVTEGPRGNLHFHLDNGQVWRQIEARRFRYPKNEAFGILISQGLMGEYRLRTAPDAPATRIRRIE